jgi:hypothetical protein
VSSRLLFLPELSETEIHARSGSAGISHSHRIFTVKIEKRLKRRAVAQRRCSDSHCLEEAGLRRRTLCAYHRFLVGFFGVNAPQEEGAWLEATDGTRHPIPGSCSLGRTDADATNTAAGLSTIARTSLPLRNFKIGADHFGPGEGTSSWPQCRVSGFRAPKPSATSA